MKFYGIIKTIKEKHVGNDDKEKAEMIFSTVHRCKGMEYDAIHLVSDFMTEERLKKQLKEKKEEELNKPKLYEEINLLYVAITRAKNIIHIPETLVPPAFPVSRHINIIKVVSEEDKKKAKLNVRNPAVGGAKAIYNPQARKTNMEAGKAYSLQKIRENHKGAYQPWTDGLDEEMTNMYVKDANVQEMAKHFSRTKGSILSRMKKLNLYELYG